MKNSKKLYVIANIFLVIILAIINMTFQKEIITYEAVPFFALVIGGLVITTAYTLIGELFDFLFKRGILK